jgi:hypothetical protein
MIAIETERLAKLLECKVSLWYRVILQKLVVSQLVNKFSVGMEQECS